MIGRSKAVIIGHASAARRRLRLRPGCGIVIPVFVSPANLPAHMRLSSWLARMLMKAGGLACVGVSWFAVASAAPLPGAPLSGDAPQPCRSGTVIPRGPTLPDIFLSDAERAGLIDTDALFQGANRPPDDDDNAVIQDDSPAAWIDANRGTWPALEPLGTLAKSPESLPTHRFLPRRSPRGPPVSS